MSYVLLKPLRVWRKHRSIKRQLAELASTERRPAVHEGFYAVA